ncbi:hypothetical protein [Serratia odorifera]|uniref:hypothetical protein n=1 Tax=Serratia odorifera TaxID=618 RepID=UPI001F5453B8|nr:hypothetical protein [Serratia odorifera]
MSATRRIFQRDKGIVKTWLAGLFGDFLDFLQLLFNPRVDGRRVVRFLDLIKRRRLERQTALVEETGWRSFSADPGWASPVTFTSFTWPLGTPVWSESSLVSSACAWLASATPIASTKVG